MKLKFLLLSILFLTPKLLQPEKKLFLLIVAKFEKEESFLRTVAACISGSRFFDKLKF
jgi:hypothetical protein